jgi:hypothetical protein
MKKVINFIKYLFMPRFQHLKTIELSTGVKCIHKKDKYTNATRIIVE